MLQAVSYSIFIAMKFRLIALAVIPLALAACQSTTSPTTTPSSQTATLKQQDLKMTLSQYQWRHENPGPLKPIILNFNTDGNLLISTSCNSMFTQWNLKGQSLTTGPIATTMIGCQGDIAKQEQFAASLFDEKQPAQISVDLSNVEQPILTLRSSNGQSTRFFGTMTPETRYQTQADTIFLEISPETKSCTGVVPQTCLQVREIKYNKAGVKTQVDKDWSLFYDLIEGFQHQPDERQIIRVKRYEIKKPAADQSKYAYVYDMAVEREALKSTL